MFNWSDYDGTWRSMGLCINELGDVLVDFREPTGLVPGISTTLG